MFEEVIVGEQVAGEAVKLRKEVEGLIDHWNKSTFDIGILLFTIKKKGFYKDYGFNSFLEYASELNIKTRKIQYLVRIIDVMDQVNVERAEFEPVGVAKLREITSLNITDEDGDPAIFEDEDGKTHIISDIIKALVSKAPEMSLNEVKQYVRVIKGFVGDNDIAWLNISVNRQALEQTIQPALDLSKKNLGTAGTDDDGMAKDYGDGKALEMICIEYLNDPASNYLGNTNSYTYAKEGV